MRASAKTRPIEKTEILIGRERPRRFLVPKRHAQGVAQLLEEYEGPTDKEIPMCVEQSTYNAHSNRILDTI